MVSLIRRYILKNKKDGGHIMYLICLFQILCIVIFLKHKSVSLIRSFFFFTDMYVYNMLYCIVFSNLFLSEATNIVSLKIFPSM